jgi:hypothetical protein
MLSPDAQPTSPLPRLAIRLLSVCPNSASCERLFSLLKRTMTPARSRLTSQNLLTIAELHAHVRQGQKRGGFSRSLRPERHLNESSQTLQALSSLSLLQESNESVVTLVDHSSVSWTMEGSKKDSRTTNKDMGLHTSNDDIDTDENDISGLSEIARSLIDAADKDCEEPEPGPVPAAAYALKNSPIDTGFPFLLDITDVFNFKDTYWVRAIEDLAETGLAHEISLCEEIWSEIPDSDVVEDIE